jgi:hypothetical protein
MPILVNIINIMHSSAYNAVLRLLKPEKLWICKVFVIVSQKNGMFHMKHFGGNKKAPPILERLMRMGLNYFISSSLRCYLEQ